MMSSKKTKNSTLSETMPHSGHYFGDQRDFWWNYDFLELMARRWDLTNKDTVLDVGCGVGHWGRTLAPFLKSSAKIYGIDLEEQWIEKAKENANNKEFSQSFHYQVSSAEKIPFEDNFFDLVTCQTVLIHVKNIDAVLKEMLRVLKPGGLLAVAEPNNIIQSLILHPDSINEPVDEILKHVHFQLMCEHGKQKLGLGYNSAGDFLPHHFSKMHLEDIQIYLSDKTSPLIPPYSSKEQQVLIEHLLKWKDQEMFIWPKEEAKRYYLANGGTEEAFNTYWQNHQTSKENVTAIENKTLCSIGAAMMYLISGKKKQN